MVIFQAPNSKHFSWQTKKTNLQSFSDCRAQWSKESQWENDCSSLCTSVSVTTGCSIKNIGMSLKSNTSFGMTSSCTPRLLGIRWSNLLKLVPSQLKASLKAPMKLGVLEMSFVDMTTWESLGIGSVNVCR